MIVSVKSGELSNVYIVIILNSIIFVIAKVLLSKISTLYRNIKVPKVI